MIAVVELAKDKKPSSGSAPNPGPVPQDVIDFFKRKKLKPSFSYKEVWAEEHTHAFTVAKIMELSILRDVQESLTKAIENGTTLEDWKKTVRPALQNSGWSSAVSDKAKPSRLKVIYETNMRVARAVGQEERAQKTKKDLPYFIYEVGPSKIHREEHKSWDKLILPVDDPFWKEHSPPLGYGCKCRRRQITAREAGKLGGEGDPPAEKRVKWQLPDGRTGTAPEGVHPTFAYPKTSEARGESLNKALETAEAGEDGPKEKTHAGAATIELATERDRTAADAQCLARGLSDGARLVLAEMIENCPREFDTTGVSKFLQDKKTVRKYVTAELLPLGLAAENAAQGGRLNLYPTDLGRCVNEILIK